jgi:hypothetical protein
MVVDKIFPHYPNYSFLQLEEINQTIYNYARLPFYEWYCFDLLKITDKYPSLGTTKGINKSFYNLRYDFSIISCTISNNVYTYTFEIRNTLWTGKWKLTTITGEEISKDDYTVTTNNKNGNTLTLSGENLQLFKLCLELSNEDKSRDIDTNYLSIRFEKVYEFTHQFDVPSYEEVKVVNTSNNKPIANATVKLIPLTEKREYVDSELEEDDSYPYLKSFTTTTNDKGIAKILFTATKTPDVYYCRLEANKGESNCYTSVTDNRTQNYTREVDNVSNLSMYKGEIKTFTFKVTPINKYGVGYKPDSEVYQVDIYHTLDIAQNIPLINNLHTNTVTRKYTAYTNSNGEVTVKLNSREFYGDTSTVKIVLPETTKFDSVTSNEYVIKHEWLYAESISHLREVCENENGADAIVLKNQTYYHTDNKTININRKQYVLGAKGNSFATINSNKSVPLFTVQSGMDGSKELINSLTINGIKVVETKTVVMQKGYSYVELLNCVFTENKGELYIGAVVYQKDNSCIANIHNNYFTNNYGNNICGRGNVKISNNLFKITDVKYTYQPEPFVLEQYTGTGTLTNNQFYVNTSIDYSSGKPVIKKFSKNRSYAKISVWVGKTAKVNGKGVSQLKDDNTFNFFDSPYNNKAYIFSIYYYPYDRVKTYIVAYASGNRTNKATGHAVEGVNWAWKDGYYLVREDGKKYSTYNPFITIRNGKVIESTEIYVPSSGGVV